MSELVSFDDLQRPREPERSVRLRLLSRSVQYQCFAWVMAAFVAEAWLIFELVSEEFTLAAWARFLVPQILVLPLAVRAGIRAIRARETTLELDGPIFRIRGREGIRDEIALSDIKGYATYEEGAVWLRIETHDGRVFEIERQDLIGNGPGEESFRQRLGSRLEKDAVQNRGSRPRNPVEARAWDFFGDPPAVAMVPGKRYRYIDRSYLRKEGVDRVGALAGLIAPSGILVMALRNSASPPLALFAICLMALTLSLVLVQAWRGVRLWQACDDRFERVPDGLRVARGKRSWVVTNPQPATGFVHSVTIFGRPLLRFGNYFFDPRFIEEDE